MHLEIARNEEEYRQLSRRFGRYKRMRGEALTTLKEEKAREGQAGKFITRGESHEQVPNWRRGAGYTSEEEEQNTGRTKGQKRTGKGPERGKQDKRGITEGHWAIQRTKEEANE